MPTSDALLIYNAMDINGEKGLPMIVLRDAIKEAVNNGIQPVVTIQAWLFNTIKGYNLTECRDAVRKCLGA